MSAFAVIRMKYGDLMPYSPAVENDKMFCKISAELTKAIADGKIAIAAVMDMYQRGGDPETLLGESASESEKKKGGRPRSAAKADKSEAEADPFKATGGDLTLGS